MQCDLPPQVPGKMTSLPSYTVPVTWVGWSGICHSSKTSHQTAATPTESIPKKRHMASFPNATRADRHVFRMRVDSLTGKRSPNRVSAGPAVLRVSTQGNNALLFTVEVGSSVKWGVWNLSSWICLKHSLRCGWVAESLSSKHKALGSTFNGKNLFENENMTRPSTLKLRSFCLQRHWAKDVEWAGYIPKTWWWVPFTMTKSVNETDWRFLLAVAIHLFIWRDVYDWIRLKRLGK